MPPKSAAALAEILLLVRCLNGEADCARAGGVIPPTGTGDFDIALSTGVTSVLVVLESALNCGEAAAGGDLKGDALRAGGDEATLEICSCGGGDRFQSAVGVSGRLSALKNSWSSTVLTTLGKGLPSLSSSKSCWWRSAKKAGSCKSSLGEWKRSLGSSFRARSGGACACCCCSIARCFSFGTGVTDLESRMSLAELPSSPPDQLRLRSDLPRLPSVSPSDNAPAARLGRSSVDPYTDVARLEGKGGNGSSAIGLSVFAGVCLSTRYSGLNSLELNSVDFGLFCRVFGVIGDDGAKIGELADSFVPVRGVIGSRLNNGTRFEVGELAASGSLA